MLSALRWSPDCQPSRTARQDTAKDPRRRTWRTRWRRSRSITARRTSCSSSRPRTNRSRKTARLLPTNRGERLGHIGGNAVSCLQRLQATIPVPNAPEVLHTRPEGGIDLPWYRFGTALSPTRQDRRNCAGRQELNLRPPGPEPELKEFQGVTSGGTGSQPAERIEV